MTMFLHVKWFDWAVCGMSLWGLAGTIIGWIPPLLATVASVATISWIVRQWLWARKDRKDR